MPDDTARKSLCLGTLMRDGTFECDWLICPIKWSIAGLRSAPSRPTFQRLRLSWNLGRERWGSRGKRMCDAAW
jgi:hypothetical protein